MKPYFGLTGGWLTFWISVACSTDMALFGYDQGVFGGVNVTPDYLQTMGFTETSTTLSTVTAIYDVASAIGAISAMWLGERLGRRRTILLGSSIMCVGAILQASAFGVPQMVVARIISGIGNGLNTATAPVWQAETSKASLRGPLVVLELVCNIGGFSLSNWITYGFSFLDGGIVWRFPIAFQFIFLFIILGTVPWLPESPRWLMAHGRIDEAEQIIADLESTTLDDPYLITTSQDMQWSIQVERDNALSWSELFSLKNKGKGGTKPMRRLLLGCGAQAMSQFAGINVTSYYLPTVLQQSVHLDNQLSRLLAACNSVSYLIFGSLGIPVVEKGGRRFLMLLSSTGQCFCYLMITILLRFNSDPSLSDDYRTKLAEASIAFFFLYYVFYGFGWQGIPWVYPTEVNSMGMRTKAAGLGAATNWLVNFMVVEITPPGIGSLGWQFYIIWTVFNASFVPIVYFLYPETAGRTLEDMDRYFTEDPSLIVAFDKDAISAKRPMKYVTMETEEVRRNSSVVSQEMHRADRERRLSADHGGVMRGRHSAASRRGGDGGDGEKSWEAGVSMEEQSGMKT